MACYHPIVSNLAYLIFNKPTGIRVPKESCDSIIHCLTHDKTMNKHKGVVIYGYATNEPHISLAR